MIGAFARIEQEKSPLPYRPEAPPTEPIAEAAVFPVSNVRTTPRVPAPVVREASPGGDRPQPGVSTSNDVARLLSLVADRTRLRILRILSQGERPVVALTSELRLPQPTVSHHLAWLRMMDLVSPRRQGKHVFYALGAAAQCDEAGVLTFTASDAVVTVTPHLVA